MAHAWPPRRAATATTTDADNAATVAAHAPSPTDTDGVVPTTASPAPPQQTSMTTVVPVRVYGASAGGGYFDTELDVHAPLQTLQRAIEAYLRIKCELQLLLHSRQQVDCHRSLYDNGCVLRKGDPFVKLVCAVKRGPLLNVLCKLPARPRRAPSRHGNSRQEQHGLDDDNVVVLACHEQDTVWDVKRQLCAELNAQANNNTNDNNNDDDARRVAAARRAYPQRARLLWRYVELRDATTLLEHRVPTNAVLQVQWRRGVRVTDDDDGDVALAPRRSSAGARRRTTSSAAGGERVPEAARTVRRRPSRRLRDAPLNYHSLAPFDAPPPPTTRDAQVIAYDSDTDDGGDDELQQQQQPMMTRHDAQDATAPAPPFLVALSPSYVPVAGVGAPLSSASFAPPPPPQQQQQEVEQAYDAYDDAYAAANIEQQQQQAATALQPQHDDAHDETTTATVAAVSVTALRATVAQLEAHVAELRARATAATRSQQTRDATYAAAAARTAQRIDELEATTTRLHAYMQRALALLT